MAPEPASENASHVQSLDFYPGPRKKQKDQKGEQKVPAILGALEVLARYDSPALSPVEIMTTMTSMTSPTSTF